MSKSLKKSLKKFLKTNENPVDLFYTKISIFRCEQIQKQLPEEIIDKIISQLYCDSIQFVCSPKGIFMTLFNKVPHSICDNPAIIYPYKRKNRFSTGKREWYRNGLLHRDGDKPAVISIDKDTGDVIQEWWYNGVRHREHDKPAIKNSQLKLKEWWYNGIRHRENDKPSILLKSILLTKESNSILIKRNYFLFFHFHLFNKHLITSKLSLKKDLIKKFLIRSDLLFAV
jgi:hypothetical protein